jgi:CubicO group peptidase (beta-lactamase class C family)
VKALTRTTQVVQEAIAARVFPGAVVEVGTSAAPLTRLALGTLTYDAGSPRVDGQTVYDLASLTKVLCTTTVALGLVERGAIGLDDLVARWCPEWTSDDRQSVTVRHLLEHASGLPAHRPYYERLSGRAAFESAIAVEPLEYAAGSRSVYSDVGFILLGLILGRAGNATLDAQFDRWRDATLGPGAALRFLPPAAWKPRAAPTEMDPWRGRLLVGEVHDENAAALGGVAAHAGLFGTAAAVGASARWWMEAIARSPIAAAFTRKGSVPGSSRAIGWDTMLPTSSCGTQMSPTAVGHTGFTGTSLWMDAAEDRYVVCLSNRVHPRREGDAMARVRPAIHNAVAGDLGRS